MGDDPQQQSESKPVEGGADPAPSSPTEAQVSPADPPAESGDFLNQGDLDALLSAAGGGDAGGAGEVVGTLGQTEAKAGVAQSNEVPAKAVPSETPQSVAASAPDVQRFEFADFNAAAAAGVDVKRVTMLSDVNLRVKIELGRTRMLVEEVLKLGEGSVVELDKLAGDPVDVYANERLVARGEVLVLDDSFCVRINEVISRDPHRITR